MDKEKLSYERTTRKILLGCVDVKEIKTRMRLTEPEVSFKVGDAIIGGVITKAVWSQERRPGLWQDMISALKRGASKTAEGTAEAFLFQAMVDRLLEEYHTEIDKK